jgi:hypothetical protein
MTPTLVFRGLPQSSGSAPLSFATSPLLVIGSPGGPSITSHVLNVLLRVFEYGLPLQNATDADRVISMNDALGGSFVEVSGAGQGFSQAVASALQARGYNITQKPFEPGCVTAVLSTELMVGDDSEREAPRSRKLGGGSAAGRAADANLGGAPLPPLAANSRLFSAADVRRMPTALAEGY